MKLEGKWVLVVGTGISGIAATDLLVKQGASVILYDGNRDLNKEEIAKRLEQTDKVEIVLGDLNDVIKKKVELVVLSPGVPTDLPFVLELKTNGLPIWGEVELAYQYSKGKIVGITGTNGKTTTTALVGEIMKTFYEEVFVVGNIGIPYTQMVLDMTEKSVTVAEMSSFQLETIQEFRPNVAAILNITPDHLNRHYTMENYIAAKANITKNQTCEDTLVLNYEDMQLRKVAEDTNAKVVYFSSAHELEDGIFLKGEDIYLAVNGKAEQICNIHELKLLGVHNYENVMAGIAMAMSLQVPLDCIKKGITSFVAVEHRIEFVKEVKGVKYYNDSKGTNPDAAIKGIQAMITPTVLIGGGYDKSSEYEEWIESFDGKVKLLILLGQTKEKIAAAADHVGFKEYVFVESLEEAVELAAKTAKEGESVLLSPACASWGMFKNYEERGRIFKELVCAL